MSVQETWSIVVNGPTDGLEVAVRLADANRAELRWAGLWPSNGSESAITAHFGSRLVSRAVEPAFMLLLPNPSIDDVRVFVAHAGETPTCIHWSPRLYDADAGGDAPWISFVDPYGVRRDDARVYGFELAGNAVPLTTMGDRPSSPELVFGPAVAAGWALHLVAIRDHMSAAELQSWIAEAASVAPSLVRNVSAP